MVSITINLHSLRRIPFNAPYCHRNDDDYGSYTAQDDSCGVVVWRSWSRLDGGEQLDSELVLTLRVLGVESEAGLSVILRKLIFVIAFRDISVWDQFCVG